MSDPTPSHATPRARLGRFRSVAFMLVATICFSCMHAAIRHVADNLHPFEIAFFRNFFGVVFLTPYFLRYGLAPLRTKNLRLHGFRSILNLSSMLCFFYALSIAPFADVTALTFSGPVFASVLAVFFLGEMIGIRRWCAILIGLLGTLVILRPGIGAVALGPLLALAAALIWACALIIIKVLLRTESSLMITAYMMIMLTPLSLVPALFVWQWPSAWQLVWLFAIAAVGTTGHLFQNQALKEADTSVVMPLDYVRLVWASLLAYFAFAEIPDAFTWLGGVMIGASAAYIGYREGGRSQSRPS